MKVDGHSADVQHGLVQIGPVVEVMVVVRMVPAPQRLLLHSASTRHFAPRSCGPEASLSAPPSATSEVTASSSPASTGGRMSPATQCKVVSSQREPGGQADRLLGLHATSGTSLETMRLQPAPETARTSAETSSLRLLIGTNRRAARHRPTLPARSKA